MLDFLGSTIVFGVLLLTVGRVQVNLNSTLYYNTYNYMTQNYAIEFSKNIEFEFNKIGYHVTGTKIDTADVDKIRFSYKERNSTTLVTVTYWKGVADATSRNPHDFLMLKKTNSGAVQQQCPGLTEFRLTYLNASFQTMSTPITGSRTDSIHAIRVNFRVESFEPIIMADRTDYISIYWEKLIYPRNLGNLQ
jgi:hypothetical protein